MRKPFTLILVVLVGLVLAPADAAAQGNVCVQDGGSYRLAVEGEPWAVGDPVPGQEGATFGKDCQPVLPAPPLVRATTLDNGETVVIAELLDTNGDQVPSAGDTAKYYKFPNGFTGGDYDTSLPPQECTIVAADIYPDRLQVRFDKSCRLMLIYWTDNNGFKELHERFGFHYYDNEPQKVDLLDGEVFLGRDWVKVNDQPRAEAPSNTDDPWLTVELKY